MNPADRGAGLVTLAALVTALVATRPYRGIIHDAQLYMAQALKTGGAEALAEDLTFRYGNQQGYSLFDLGYAPLIAFLGPSFGHMLALGLGLGLWLAALVFLLRVLDLGPRSGPIVAVGVLLMNPAYGSGVLRYAEGFVTPRLFSEALALAMIGLVVARRPAWAVAAGLASAALHPLVALPAVLAGLRLFLSRARDFWICLVLGTALIVGLGLGGVAPFDWFNQRFDREWLDILSRHAIVALPGAWPGASLYYAVLPGAGLAFAALGCAEPLRRLCRTCLLVAALGVVVALAGTVLAENRLIAAVQPWRALWLLSLGGNLAVLVLATRGPGAGVWRVAVAVSIVEHFTNTMPLASSLIALAPVLALIPGRAGRWLSALPAVLATYVIVSLPFVLRPEPEQWLLFGLACIALAAVVVPPDRLFSQAAVLAMAGLGIVGLADTRSEWRRWLDAPSLPPEIAGAISGRTVYWEGGLTPLWIGARAPQYFSCRQKAGILFYREQAMEFRRRANGLHPLGTGDFRTGTRSVCPEGPGGDVRQDAASLRQVCRALPDLDLIAFLSDAPESVGRVWTIELASGSYAEGIWQNPGKRFRGKTVWRVVDCGILRTG